MKKWCIVISMILCLWLPNTVEAAYVDASSLSSKVGDVCNRDGCWPGAHKGEWLSNNGRSVRAMRVTLMDSDGRPYQGAQTLNVLPDYYTYNFLYNNSGYYYWPGNGNKVEYAKGTVAMGSPIRKQGDGALPGTGGRTMHLTVASTLDSHFTPFGVSISSKLYNWQISDIWNQFEGQKYDTTTLRDLIYAMFQVDTNDMDSETIDNLWIVAEPMTIVVYKGEYYFGTSYELAHIGNGYSSFALNNNINTVIGRMMPCAAYTTGNIIDKYPTSPGVDAGRYSYFGSLAPINDSMKLSWNGQNTKSSICAATGGAMNGRYVFSNYAVSGSGSEQIGVGINILKFPAVSKVTCQMVEDSNLATNGQSWLKGITLDALNKLPNELNYKDENGNWNKVSKDWYKKECTCYGVYEEYQSKKGTYLPDLPKINIQTIFNDQKIIFENFYNSYSELYPNTDNTEWNFDKYQRLECAFSTDPKNSCTAVKFDNVGYSIGDINQLIETNCVPLVKAAKGNWSCTNSCDYGYPPGRWTYLKRYEHLLNNYGNGSAYGVVTNSPREMYNGLPQTFRACVEQYVGSDGTGTLSCSNLPLYGSKGYTIDFVRDNVDTYRECFKLYNKLNGTNWNLSNYQAGGCAPEIDREKRKYDCTPQFNVGTCIDGGKIEYHDKSISLKTEDYWKNCVFSDDEAYRTIDVYKESNKDAHLTYFDNSIGSQYCEVYCIEDMTANFDTSVTVLAGRRFDWNNHYVSGRRTCRTKEIQYDRFVSDLEEANKEAIDQYALWKLEEKLAKVKWERSDVRLCDCTETESGETVCHKYEYYPSSSGEEVTVTAEYPFNYTVTKSVSLSASCGSKGYDANVSKYKSDYDDAVEHAKGLVSQMQACYNQGSQANWDDNVYRVNPKATISYQDGSGLYKYTDEAMDASTTYTAIEKNLDCSSDKQLILNSCQSSGSDGNYNCKLVYQNMSKCNYVQMSKGATTNFSLPQGIYEYIDKPTHEALNDTTANYIFVSQSGQLPVAYSTPDGLYGELHGNGQLSLEYSNLGHTKNTEARETDVDSILSYNRADNYKDWICEFEVVSKLIPDPDPGNPGTGKNSRGIRVIYRPIDLKDPFPDIDATGRQTGSNWCSKWSCDSKNETVEEVILNNRGVTGSEVYNKTPMYSITLTPELILSIREYNKNNPYDDFNLTCEEGTGKKCISNYLTDLLKLSGGSGTCTTGLGGSIDGRLTNFDSCQD